MRALADVVSLALASIDDAKDLARVDAPDGAAMLLMWSAVHQSITVVGLRDDDDVELSVAPDLLARLTSVIARPVPSEAIVLAFPDADITSGTVLLTASVDEPVWAQVVDRVAGQVDYGLRTREDDIRHALWLALNAAHLPVGGLWVSRVTLVPELPDDTLFTVESLGTSRDVPRPVEWRSAVESFPLTELPRVVELLASRLAERDERHLNQVSTQPQILSRHWVQL